MWVIEDKVFPTQVVREEIRQEEMDLHSHV